MTAPIKATKTLSCSASFRKRRKTPPKSSMNILTPGCPSHPSHFERIDITVPCETVHRCAFFQTKVQPAKSRGGAAVRARRPDPKEARFSLRGRPTQRCLDQSQTHPTTGVRHRWLYLTFACLSVRNPMTRNVPLTSEFRTGVVLSRAPLTPGVSSPDDTCLK
jgi:hypothetical protein